MGDNVRSARISPELAFAYFVWGNLLLSNKASYSSGSRLLSDNRQDDENGADANNNEGDDSDSEDDRDVPDKGSVVNTILERPGLELLQEKFLDALSGIFARQKGRDDRGRYVTGACLEKHTAVTTIVLARNDGFDLQENGEDRDFIKTFETFMASCHLLEDSAGDESSLIETFLETTLRYGYLRYLPHVSKVRKILRSTLSMDNFKQPMENVSPTQELLMKLKVLVLPEASNSYDMKNQMELVKLAYEFQKSPVPISVLSIDMETAAAEQLSRQLRLIAKPMAALKTFVQLAAAASEFRNVKVVTLDAPDPVQLDQNHRALAEKMWSDLNLPKLNTDEQTMDARERFDDYCKTGLQVHPEIQLASYYDSYKQESSQVFPYIGTSKRPCRLCEEFLRHEDLGIQFRMHHGCKRILPRWGIPKNKLESYLSKIERIGSQVLKDFSHFIDYPSLKAKAAMPETIAKTGTKTDEIRTLREVKRRASQQDPDPRQRRRSFLRLRMDGPRYFDKDESQPWTRTVLMQDRCVNCGKFATAQCQKCKNCKYCSKNCQEQDWKIHKKICRRFAKLAVDDPETSPIMLFFPPDGSKLSLLRLNIEPYVDEHEYRGIELSQATRFIFKHQLPQSKIIKRNIYDNEDFGFAFVIRSGDEIVYNEPEKDLIEHSSSQTPRNSLVDELVSIKYGKSRASADWRGSLLVMKEAPRSPEADPEEDPQYQDFLPRDLNLLIDYFAEFGNEDVDRKFPATRPTAKGVKVTFDVDRENLGSERYESIDVPLDYTIWDQSPTQVSERVGFPVIARRYIKDIALMNAEDKDPFRRAGDGTAIWLLLDIKEDAGAPAANPEAVSEPNGFGRVPLAWTNFVGSIILVRQGRQSLLLEQAKAMCDFCQHYLRPLLEAYQESEDSSSIDDIREKVSRKGFEKYLSSHQRNLYPPVAESDSAVEHEEEL